MSDPLNKDSKMECERHGKQKPSFICKHLQYGENIGFFEATDNADPDLPFKEAWCSECDTVLIEQGEWNDISEGHAQIIVICEGCYNEVKERNT